MYAPLTIFLFFLSGIAGLIYESIWTHYLKLFLGHAAYAQTLVLVIYMGGMACGAWIAGEKIYRTRNLLEKYALIELSLGIAALFFHPLFVHYQNVSFTTILPFLSVKQLILLYKWVSGALIILPQSMLLGATFPLMAAGYIRRFRGVSGYNVAILYFANSFGAAIGVLLSGFYLIGTVGLEGTIRTAGILDILVGAAVLLIARVAPKEQPQENAVPPTDAAAVFSDRSPHPRYMPLLGIAAITAMASFMYEIGWIRMLSLVLGSSTHSFEMMLSTFILGIALGSFFIRKKIDHLRVPHALILAQVIMGGAALLSVLLYSRMFYLVQFVMTALKNNPQGYFLFNITSDIVCMIIMLPATLCAGVVLPLIVKLFYTWSAGERNIGRVYALNTFGGIIGILLSVWLIMPFTGVRLLVTLGGIIDMGIGIYLLYYFGLSPESKLKRFLPALCIAVALFSVALGRVDPALAASGVFRNGTIAKNIRMLSHVDGRTATISLYRNNNNIVLSTNGKPDAGINVKGGICGDEYTMSLLGVLPMSMVQDRAHAAIIGLGSGMTAHYLLYDSTLESLDIIEIEPAVVQAAATIGTKVEQAFSDPRAHIYIDDAKSFFSTSPRTYDIIISEPSNPWVSGVSGLFSEEFFAQVKNHLSTNGILVQWFHRYESDISVVASMFGALEQHFPYYQLFAVGSDCIVVASKNSSAPRYCSRPVFDTPALASRMAEMGFYSVDDLNALRIFSHKTMHQLLALFPTPPNSDFAPFIDLNAVRYRFIDENIRELDTLYQYIVPVRKIIEADTGYVSIVNRDTVPDLSNLSPIVAAKKLLRELTRPPEVCSDTTACEVTSVALLLDYIAIAPERFNYDIVFGTIIETLEKSLPWLSKNEMADLWESISARCIPLVTTENEKRWMDYFSALCRYDFESIRTLSAVLLPQAGPIEDDYVNRMLLTSLSIASSALEDTADDRYFYRFTSRRHPGMMISLSRNWPGYPRQPNGASVAVP